jgi:beta-galactosidase
LADNSFSQNSLPYGRSFDWANDGGIYRDVILHVTERPAIDYVLIDAVPETYDSPTKGNVNLRIALIDAPQEA